jgi:hypothetical protein
MSRAIRLSLKAAERLGRPTKGGAPVRFRFVQGGDDDKRWNLENISNILRSLPGRYRVKSFEIWVSSTEISLVAWAPDKDSAKRIVSHWKNFNPAIQKQTAPYHFPPLQPGSYVRVGRVAPQRAAKHPFDSRFGRQGLKLLSSPIVHILHNIPLLPDGTQLVIQFLWRQHRLPWFWWPWAHWDFRPWLGRDDEGLDEKRDHRLSYYCDIRILEVNSTAPSAADHAGTTAQAFLVYRRDNANSLVYRSFPWWGRRRILRFVRSMQERDLSAFRMSLWRRPRYTIDELAALIHPPPPGATVPGLAYTSVKQVGASGSAETQAAALRKAVLDKLSATHADAVRGRSRKLKAQDVEAILRREGGP